MATVVDSSQGPSSSQAPTRSESLTSSLNPLLSRGKLNKATPSKKKKETKKKDKTKINPEQTVVGASTSTSSSAVTPTGTGTGSTKSPRGGAVGADGDEDDEASDLADQLLSQLEATRNAASPEATSSPSSAAPPSTSTPSTTTTSSSRTSVSSASTSKREKLHNLSDDMRHLLLPNSQGKDKDKDKDKDSGRGGLFASQGMSRQKMRKMRKEKELEQIKHHAQQEVLHANDNSIEEERQAMHEDVRAWASGSKRSIRMGIGAFDSSWGTMIIWSLTLRPYNSLYSAIADQANHLRLSVRIFFCTRQRHFTADLALTIQQTTKETYLTTRKHAAAYMRGHPDDFLPFLESSDQAEALMTPEEYENYCATVENTAEWGGEPEIRALAKHYNVQIHVLQAGTDLLKVGEDDLPLGPAGPIRISYHRKMYGLGEHYNSLVPATYAPPAVGVCDPIARCMIMSVRSRDTYEDRVETLDCNTALRTTFMRKLVDRLLAHPLQQASKTNPSSHEQYEDPGKENRPEKQPFGGGKP
ncbi:BQ5605_C137g13406 [Microbotryum silenes-dioicae]|uniref:BQ5605_C137g13406 protein n=1 Tax=Microbotryum silenes-dioicae TaxID=796604 RepID=A0A2X0P9N2_9BASI|nr:BQ5605_C137g13406 [Microbotryum silenes-dioicae]